MLVSSTSALVAHGSTHMEDQVSDDVEPGFEFRRFALAYLVRQLNGKEKR
ncbi:MAG TPA: hypothetical protein VFT89_13850 [Rhizobiaceae bacterium]|nr:hypothetical protein [Rhizobiaceae bacterium]